MDGEINVFALAAIAQGRIVYLHPFQGGSNICHFRKMFLNYSLAIEDEVPWQPLFSKFRANR